MNRHYDVSVQKTIESDRHADLAAQARAMTGKLSAKVEELLAEYIAKERHSHSHSAGALELQRATSEWKAFTEAHGSFADEFPRCDRPVRCSRQCRPEHEHPVRARRSVEHFRHLATPRRRPLIRKSKLFADPIPLHPGTHHRRPPRDPATPGNDLDTAVRAQHTYRHTEGPGPDPHRRPGRAVHPLVRLAPNTAAGVANCVPPSALRAPSPAGGGRESIA